MRKGGKKHARKKIESIFGEVNEGDQINIIGQISSKVNESNEKTSKTIAEKLFFYHLN